MTFTLKPDSIMLKFKLQKTGAPWDYLQIAHHAIRMFSLGNLYPQK